MNNVKRGCDIFCHAELKYTTIATGTVHDGKCYKEIQEVVDGSSAKSPSGGVHVAPSMAATLVNEDFPEQAGVLGSGILRICVLSSLLGFVGFVAAMILIKAIGRLTNLCFYGRWSFAFVPPTDAHLGYWIILIPVAGAVAVGLLARYGHAGIRGHGIPEAMESILTKDSRVPRSIVFLKPLSAVLSIGTGGPFGAEGPIIATGGAFGSMIGQMLHTTAEERKILLSAGAAAGMSATFGSPIAAILLAVELLLFEFSPRSLIPVALASGIAAGLRILVLGASPIFHMQPFGAPTHFSLLFYAIIGLICGLASVGVTKALFLVEDLFEKHIPVHWMWWPAIAAVVVGVCGIIDINSMGVGYDHISAILSAHWALTAVVLLLIFKWISWTIALGSGTSGGTLAPLFMLGGALGFLLGAAIVHLVPEAGVNVRVAALVGMAALFAGASRAFLTSVVFAFETTLQPHGLLPLLIGSVLAFWVSCVLMPDSIMTEKITRRGVTVPTNYLASPLDRLRARDALPPKVPVIRTEQTVAEALLLAPPPKSGEKSYLVVVDSSHHAVGILDFAELKKFDLNINAPVGSLPLIQVPALKADHSLRVASRVVVDSTPHAVIVVDPAASDSALGVLTPEDILKTTTNR